VSDQPRTSRPLDERDARVAELIGLYFEGEISDAESAELAGYLERDEEARRQFVAFGVNRSLLPRTLASMRSTGELHEVGGDRREGVIGRVDRRVDSWTRSPLAQAAMLAIAVTLFVVFIASMGGRDATTEPVAGDPTKPQPLATVTDVRGAVWGGDAAATIRPTAGDALDAGSIELESGATQLVFANGAVVDVLGPARFRIVGRDRGYLESGRVLVWVPREAQGFTIATESGDIVDLGTEFGVHVDGSGISEVHVIKGKVRAEMRTVGGGKRAINLGASSALRFDAVAQSMEPVGINLELFGRTFGGSITEGAAFSDDRGVAVNFEDHDVKPYGGMQDGQHGFPAEATLLDGGRTLKLTGNTWKMIELPYTLTENTVVSFDFHSTSEGQIHGFGFDTDSVYEREKGFPAVQVFGRETWPRINRTYWNYKADGGWKHYVIRVGDLHTGKMRYMYFLADDDIDGNADSYFRNVRVYEATRLNPPDASN